MAKPSIIHFYDTIAAMLLLVTLSISCQNNDYYNQLPEQLTSFIAHYFPNTGVENYTHNNDKYVVVLKDGPGLTFSSSYAWIDINGNGAVLPQVLLFDQLPPAVYQYLQETEQLHSVFAISRSKTEYTIALLDTTLIYDISTDSLHGG
jgi:hypothetical protein